MEPSYKNNKEAVVWGPTETPLWMTTLGSLVDEQAKRFGERPAVAFPCQGIRLTFQELVDRSWCLAEALLQMDIQHGDCIGVMAGNTLHSIEVFLAGARIGCPIVSLNGTYTPEELKTAVRSTSCKLLFIARHIGGRDLTTHFRMLRDLSLSGGLPDLQQVICLGSSVYPEHQNYENLTLDKRGATARSSLVKSAEEKVKPNDILNLQFTSGTTGEPKAATLTHINLLNNARFFGHTLQLTPRDIVCCPPPLFHCFGLVLGLLASLCHGSSIVFPSDHFEASLVLKAVQMEGATVLLGVPTMFSAELEANRRGKYNIHLRAAVVGGSSIPTHLMRNLQEELKIRNVLPIYGMTETSPATFMTCLDDPEEKRLATVGRVMPHTGAKVLDKNGRIIYRGQRGQLYISGYALQKGYYKNPAKTAEVMSQNEQGILWMETGDEAIIDEDGYCRITGRIKDIIIRGGENISPLEIEEQLHRHPLISEASVFGLPDQKYGEVVGCFLKATRSGKVLSDDGVRDWVRTTLAWQKAPTHVFWIGDPGVGSDFPKTGSGKHQKQEMRKIGNGLIMSRT